MNTNENDVNNPAPAQVETANPPVAKRAGRPRKQIDAEPARKSVRSEEDRPKRPKRIPFGTKQARLSANQRPGFHRCWINDTEDNLDKALAGYYEFVHSQENSTDLGTRISRTTGTQVSGSGMRSYLMEIPEEYWNEDQASIQKDVDAVEDAIRRKSHPGLAQSVQDNHLDVRINTASSR